MSLQKYCKDVIHNCKSYTVTKKLTLQVLHHGISLNLKTLSLSKYNNNILIRNTYKYLRERISFLLIFYITKKSVKYCNIVLIAYILYTYQYKNFVTNTVKKKLITNVIISKFNVKI